jgi:hypothetical protein
MAPKRKLSGTIKPSASRRKTNRNADDSSAPGVIDDINAARASPAPIFKEEVEIAGLKTTSELPQRSKTKTALDRESDFDPDGEEDEEVLQAAISRPPPVYSSYIPLPWKGRLGYVSSPFVDYLMTKLLICVGLSQYIFKIFQSSCVQLKDVSYCFNH